jgi:hypothetical protein
VRVRRPPQLLTSIPWSGTRKHLQIVRHMFPGSSCQFLQSIVVIDVSNEMDDVFSGVAKADPRTVGGPQNGSRTHVLVSHVRMTGTGITLPGRYAPAPVEVPGRRCAFAPAPAEISERRGAIAPASAEVPDRRRPFTPASAEVPGRRCSFAPAPAEISGRRCMPAPAGILVRVWPAEPASPAAGERPPVTHGRCPRDGGSGGTPRRPTPEGDGATAPCKQRGHLVVCSSGRHGEGSWGEW